MISCKNFLPDFERRGNINRKQLDPNVFSLRSNVISPLCKALLTEMAEIALSVEEGVGTGAQLALK